MSTPQIKRNPKRHTYNPSMRHKAHIAYHAKGRLRFRVPTAKGNKAALETIKKSLTSMTGVREVVVNPEIGTVTVNYDPKRHVDFHEELAGRGKHQETLNLAPPPRLTEVDEMAEILEQEVEYLSKHSHTAKAVIELVRQFDRGLKHVTGNQIDLKVVAPLGLAVYAFLQMGFEAATPVWLTLGIFSFNHFVELHTRHDSGQPEPGPVAPPKRSRPVKSV
jgi:hypothetical protein